jgi:hypothetical protein
MANPLVPVPGNQLVFSDPQTEAEYYASLGTTPEGAVQQEGDQANSLLGAIRQAIAPNPGRVYGDILPVSRDIGAGPDNGLNTNVNSFTQTSFAPGQTSEPGGGYHLAVPNAVRGLVNGILDLVESPTTGQITPSAQGALLASAAPELLAAPEEGVLKTFGGVGAKTADLGALDKAKAMLAMGHSPDNVWQKTGWHINPLDQKPRFEISDKGMAPTPAYINAIKQYPSSAFKGKLGDLLQHDELFKAYPHLKDATITVAPQGVYFEHGITGGYSPPVKNTITGQVLHPDDFFLAGDQAPSDIKKTLVHELQHAIQDYEGFEPGGNNDIAQQAVQKMALMQKLGALPPVLNGALAYNEDSSPFSQYQNLAGEAESRDVEKRLDWTPEDQRYFVPGTTQLTVRNQIPVNLINKAAAQVLANRGAK